MLDDLNMKLFEVSECGNHDPHTFYAAVANICISAGIGIKDASLMNFDADDFDAWPEVAAVREKDGIPKSIYLYLAYSRKRPNRPFASHAELVTAKELDDIMRVANHSAVNDSDED